MRTGAAGASRLCKAGFLFRVREIARLLKRSELVNCSRYAEVKSTSRDYQNAKLLLYSSLSSAQRGGWVKKPRELELFAK